MVSVIPFQLGDMKKLVMIDWGEKHFNPHTIQAVISRTFKVSTFKLYNKKIGFEIPEDLLLPYLEQRTDFTNFVIEVVESSHEPLNVPPLDLNLSESFTQNKSKRSCPTNSDHESDAKRAKQSPVAHVNPYNALQEALDTPAGKELSLAFDEHQTFDEDQQTLLAKLVTTSEVDTLLQSNSPLTISSAQFTHLAEAIRDRFPNEDTATYYDSPFRNLLSVATGKFPHEFNSFKCRYLRKQAKTRYRQSGHSVQADFPELNEFRELQENLLLYFKAWQQTHDLRMVYLSNIEEPLTYFSNLIGSIGDRGVELIEYDFERLHPGKGQNPLDNWDQISERIFTEALVSSRNDVPLILDLYGNTPQLSSFMMFSYFLENFEGDVQPFERDSLGNLVIHVDTIGENPMDTFNTYLKRQSQLSPRVFVTGKSEEELRCYVAVGNSFFLVGSVLSAVDFCFKCFRVLHLSYPREQNQAWNLLQNAIYDIPLEEDGVVCEQFLDILKIS